MGHRLLYRKGISLLEVTISLAAAAILAGALTPTLLTSFRKARLAAAQAQTCAIKDAILVVLTDISTDGFVQDASLPAEQQLPVELAVGDGDIPELGPDGDALWTRSVNFAEVDFLSYHLVTNNPGNDAAHAYSNWFGAYIEAPIDPDPWGNRYMVNTIYLRSGSTYDVVVLSAGPDEEVDSAWSEDGFEPGDDDIVCLVGIGPGGPCNLTVCNDGYDSLRVYVNDNLQSPEVADGQCETWTLIQDDQITVDALVALTWRRIDQITLRTCPTTKTYARIPCSLTVCNVTYAHKLVVSANGVPLSPQVTKGSCETWDLTLGDLIRVETFVGVFVDQFTLTDCPTTKNYW